MMAREIRSSSGCARRGMVPAPGRLSGRRRRHACAAFWLCAALWVAVALSPATAGAPPWSGLRSPALTDRPISSLTDRAMPALAGGIAPAGVRSMLATGEAATMVPQIAPAHRTSRQAILPALMSAIVPGSGQLRNGSVLKGIAFAAVELTGWTAWFAFRHQESEKHDDIEAFGDRFWDYERYHRVASNPDSCAVHGCPCGLYSPEADSLIQVARDEGGNRFYGYLTRSTYACGWNAQLSRDLYLGLHDDREDLLDAKRLTGRLIFLNHIVSAVDAFLQARRVRVAGFADVGLRMAGPPSRPQAQLILTKRWD